MRAVQVICSVLALIALPSVSQALDCSHRDSGLLTTDDIVIGEVTRVTHLRSEIADKEWYLARGTKVQVYRATMKPLKVLRGDEKLPTLTYEFNEPKGGCEYLRPTVKVGQRVLFGTWSRPAGLSAGAWDAWAYPNTLRNRLMARRKQLR